jgi:hypothetical protein
MFKAFVQFFVGLWKRIFPPDAPIIDVAQEALPSPDDRMPFDVSQGYRFLRDLDGAEFDPIFDEFSVASSNPRVRYADVEDLRKFVMSSRFIDGVATGGIDRRLAMNLSSLARRR